MSDRYRAVGVILIFGIIPASYGIECLVFYDWRVAWPFIAWGSMVAVFGFFLWRYKQ